MASYQPLRDAFKDINQMITDSQQWDAQHKQNALANERKDIMLQSELQQREFTNSMAQKKFQLEQMGEQRAAKALDQQILNQNRNWGIAKAESDRSAALHPGALKKQRLDLEAQRDTNTMLSLEADRALYDAEVVPVTLKDVITDPNVYQNPAYIAEVNQTANAMGLLLREDNNFYNAETGEPAQLKRSEQTALQMAGVAAAEIHRDADAERGIARQQLYQQGLEIDKQLKKLNPDNRMNLAKRAELKRDQQAILKAAYELRQEGIADRSAEGLYNKADRLMRAAVKMSDDPKQAGMVATLQARAAALRGQADEMVQAEGKTRAEQAKDAKVVDVGNKYIDEDIVPQGTLIKHDDQRHAVKSQVRARYTDMVRKRAPKTDDEAQLMGALALKVVEEEHNTLVATYKKKRVAIKNDRIFKEWYEKEYLPKAAKMGFDKYIPKEEWRIQVRGGD